MASTDLVPRRPPRAPRSLERVVAKGVATRAGAWWFLNVANRVDPVLMRISGGRLTSAPGAPVVLLHHVGARSGQGRTTPLLYFSDGDDVVLIGSNGGSPKHPAWYHNVRANPEVRLSARGREGTYRAREAEGEERERLWKLAAMLYPGYEVYKERAGARRIPVVVFSPVDDR